MIEWFDGLPELDKAFTAAVVIGGALFVVRVVLSVFGGDDLTEAEDAGTGGNGAQASFRILSFQGLSAFTTMFGLVGLALSRQQGFPATPAILGGFVAGVATVWVIGRVFIGIGKLESDGTIRLARAVGVVGTVDLTVPPGGVGKVRIIIQDRLRVYDAVSMHTTPLPTGRRVRVIDVTPENSLVVEPYAISEPQKEAK